MGIATEAIVEETVAAEPVLNKEDSSLAAQLRDDLSLPEDQRTAKAMEYLTKGIGLLGWKVGTEVDVDQYDGMVIGNQDFMERVLPNCNDKLKLLG